MFRLSFTSVAKYAVLMSSLSCFFFATARAQQQEPIPTAAQQQTQSVEQQLQQLKKDLISLNRDLFVLEEDLLFPSSTQVVLFLSMDVGSYFNLDSVELKIDGRTVSHYLYTDKQTKALYRGGVQRLHVDNIAQGEHQISAFFTGTGPQNRPYKRATSFTFNKKSDAKALELSIIDSTTKQQPVFTVLEL
jgi:hypothetical protein